MVKMYNLMSNLMNRNVHRLLRTAAAALLLFGALPSHAYDWVTNEGGVKSKTEITVNAIPVIPDGVVLTSGLSNVETSEYRDKVVYLYEVNSHMFINSTGHDGTGIGLMDVGCPFVFRKVTAGETYKDDKTYTEGTYKIISNFVNKPGTLPNDGICSKMQYNVARHGNSIFLDRSDQNADEIKTWSFIDADASKKDGVDNDYNHYFYIAGKPSTDGNHGYKFDKNKNYYIVLKGYDPDKNNIQDVIADKHTPFDVAISEDGSAPKNAARFILVTRQMLLDAFGKAAKYATNSNAIDATWLVKDEEFYRTNINHQLHYNGNTLDDKNNTRAWVLRGDLESLNTNYKFWPVGGTGASSNQYIGVGEFDGWTDYNKYFVARLPKTLTGGITQTVTLPEAGWYRFSVKGIGAQETDGNGLPDCLFTHVVTKDAPEGTQPDIKKISPQYVITKLQYNEFYDKEDNEAQNLHFHYDADHDFAYYTDVDGLDYFYKVIEGEDNTLVTGDGLKYGSDGDFHNSLNNVDVANKSDKVEIPNGKTANVKVTVPAEGHYVLTYYSKGGKADVTIGEKKVGYLQGNGSQAPFDIYLSNGENTISITSTNGTVNLDRITVERGRALLADEDKQGLGNIVENKPTITAISYSDDTGNYTISYSDPDNADTHWGIKKGISTVNNNADNTYHPVTYEDRTLDDGTKIKVIAGLGLGSITKYGSKTADGTTRDKNYFKNGDNGDNELEIPLNLQSDGRYKFTVYAVNQNNGDRTLRLGVSNEGGPKKHWYNYGGDDDNRGEKLSFEGTGSKNPAKLLSATSSIQSLKTSQKWLCIGSDEGWTPDIAYVTIEKIDDGAFGTSGKPYVLFKAGETKTYTVENAKAGDYRVAIWYSANQPSSLKIQANGTERNFQLDTSTFPENDINSNEIVSPFTFIPLVDGKNTITIQNTSDNDIALDNLEVNPGINAELELGRMFAASDKDKSTELSIYVPTANSQVEFGVYKTNKTQPVIIDHFRASYLGNIKGIVLDDSKDSWDYASDGANGQWKELQDQNNQGTTDKAPLNNVPVYLKRNDFGAKVEDNAGFSGQWSTIALPFNMNRQQLYDAFGSSVKVGVLDDSEGRTLNFKVFDLTREQYSGDNTKVIEAGMPYFIKVMKPASTVGAADLGTMVSSTGDITNGFSNPYIKVGDKYYIIWANIGDTGENDAFLNDGKGLTQTVTGHDGQKSLKFVATLHKISMPNGVYALANGEFKFFRGGKQHLKGLRAYIEDDADGYKPSETSTSLARPWYFGDETTGIVQIVENIDENDVKNLSPTDNKVYNLNGQQVSANKLHRGIYIRNGRKFIVK